MAEVEEGRRKKEEEKARLRQIAKEQRLGGATATDAMEGDDEFEQFDAEGDELLAEDSSEDEDSMQVVSLQPSDYASTILTRPRTTT